MIREAVAVVGGQNTERQRHRQRDDHACDRQQDRRRVAADQQLRHRLAEVERAAQIAAHQAAHVGEVLHTQRTIEPELRAQALDVTPLGTLAQHHLYRISGNQMNQREDQGRNEQRDRDRLRQPTEQVRGHRRPSAPIRYDNAWRLMPRRLAAAARLPPAPSSASCTSRLRKSSTR